MKHTVFIHTNNKQIIGAHIAKYAILSRLKNPETVDVRYINVDELPQFQKFVGTQYVFAGTEVRTYTKDDLQSFTLSRFMPPELMEYNGKAIVIDPDIFALCDIEELFTIDLQGAALAACRKKDAWDTSVMLMDCSKLTHWSMEKILTGLTEKTLTYSDVMTLRNESAKILELPRIWNDLDVYTDATKIIHMTDRLHQPWRTGLPIDFTRNPMRKILGIIPREPILKMLGKYPSHYEKHPNPRIEELFFTLAKEALQGGAFTETDVEHEIGLGHVRSDILTKLT